MLIRWIVNTYGPIDNSKWQDAKVVAQQLLRLRGDGTTTTSRQIQKLVYICHGWTLGLLNEELINEPVEAWENGPAIPSLHMEYRRFGALPIEVATRAVHRELTEQQNEIINAVHDVYFTASGAQLSALTHKRGTPWHQVKELYGIGAGVVIPSPTIRDYYRDFFGG